ncbi:hypothetical protein [Murinocardiopsis flavida]|nr:hypothetical protein [Murinocardiopsis flavida]
MDPASHPSRRAARQAPGGTDNERWWVAPAVLTLLAVPGSAVLLFAVALGQMGFDPCPPSGCPRTERHYAVTVAVAASSLIPVIGIWLVPHRRGLTWARVLAIIVYVLVFAATIGMVVTMPMGE